MLWIVSSVCIRDCIRPAYCVFISMGSTAVCQSLQWSTSGVKSSLGSASRIARAKKAYCSPSASPPR